MKRAAFLLLIITAAASAAAQSGVAVFKDRYSPPQRVELSKLPPNAQAVWIWTSDTSPHRVDVANVRDVKATVPRLLSVHAEPLRPRQPLVLVAAPVAMWEEVPEDLLPVFDVKQTLRIPIEAGSPWRLRLRGTKLGSWWIDVPPGAADVTITATIAADRTLQVLSEEGAGLGRIRLSLLDEGAERGDVRKLADYRTDDKGHLVLRSVPDSGPVTLLLAAADRAPKVIATTPSSIPPRLTLPRGSSVRGKLVDSDGLPVAQARVALRTWASEVLPLPLVGYGISDADGKWQIAALPDGKGEIEISAPGLADLTRAVAIDGTVDLGALTLQAAQLAGLSVSDERGEPIAGATIAIGPRDAAATDANGRASVKVAAHESVELRIAAPHHRTRLATVDAPPPKLTRIILQRSFRVAGRFIDANGAGIAEARARIRAGSRTETKELDSDGRFDLDLEPATDCHIEFFSPTTAVARIDVAKGNAGEIREIGDVVVPRSLTVRGRLVREGDRAPIAGARVWLPRPSESGPLMAWAFRDILETSSRANGEFELSGAPKIPFIIRIAPPSLAAIRRSIAPADDDERIDLGDIVISSGTSVVVTLDGKAIDGAVARVDIGGAGLSMDMLDAPFNDGKAIIANVAPGPVIVSAWRGREILCRQSLNIPADHNSIEVTCTIQKVTVSGIVRVGGRPAGPGTLVWLTPLGQDIPTGILTFGSGAVQQHHVFAPESPRETANVGVDGRFDGPALLPGVWEVLWMPESGRALGPRNISIAEGAATPLVLEYPGVSVDGVVLDVQRKPLKGAEVRDLGGRGFAVTREDGSFTLAGPDPGKWQLQARSAGHASAVKEIVVEENGQRPFVELTMNGDEDRLRVSAGRDAIVFLETDTGRLELSSSDASGIAVFRLAPPWPQNIRLAANIGGRWVLGDWIPWQDAVKAEATLKPGNAGALVISTKAASGAVSVTSGSGWRVDRLLQWLGAFLRLTPDDEVSVAGLPPGIYTVGVMNQQRTVTVEKEKTLRVAFD